MSTVGAHKGHVNRKLRDLLKAGAAGLSEWSWRQSLTVVPHLVREGLAVIEERVEPVRYLVITEKGKKALTEGEPD